MEIWKDILGYEGKYQASNTGKIRSLPRNANRTDGMPCKIKGRVLKPAMNKDGYYKCALCVDRKLKSYRVHILVAKTFLGKKEGLEVNHIDGNKANNCLDNLELISHRENVIHSFKNGLQISLKGSQVHNAKLKEWEIPCIRLMMNDGYSARKMARLYKMDKSVFLGIKNRKLWAHV